MQIELGHIEAAAIEVTRKGIGTGSPTATVRAFVALYVSDTSFRDDVNAAALRRGVDKDGRLTK